MVLINLSSCFRMNLPWNLQAIGSFRCELMPDILGPHLLAIANRERGGAASLSENW
jgi:hypothetical protein